MELLGLQIIEQKTFVHLQLELRKSVKYDKYIVDVNAVINDKEVKTTTNIPIVLLSIFIII